MKSIKFSCKCGNEIEFVSRYIEDDLLENTCNVKCRKCGLNTSFSLEKTTVSNAISLEALLSKDFQAVSDFFVRNSKFDTRINDIFSLKSCLDGFDLTKRTELRIKEDKEGNTYNEICVYLTPDTELLVSLYQKRTHLQFKEMIINQFVYELEVKQQ